MRRSVLHAIWSMLNKLSPHIIIIYSWYAFFAQPLVCLAIMMNLHKETWTCYRDLERFARAWTRSFVKQKKKLALLKTDDLKLKHVLQKGTWGARQRTEICYVTFQHVNWSWCRRVKWSRFWIFKREANICILIVISSGRCFVNCTIYYSVERRVICSDAIREISTQWDEADIIVEKLLINSVCFIRDKICSVKLKKLAMFQH